MNHVLTLPRVRRRRDGDEPATWVPVGVPAPTAVATEAIVRRVDGVSIRSVIQLALIFYGCVFASIAGGVLLVWIAISTMGYVGRFEDFMRSIGFRGFEVSSVDVILGLIGVAGALTLLATFLTVVAASAYNAVGNVGHGLVVRMSEPGVAHAESAAPVDDGSPHAA